MKWNLTAAGKITVEKGIQIPTAKLWGKTLDQLHINKIIPDIWVLLCSMISPDGEKFPISLSYNEKHSRIYADLLYRLAGDYRDYPIFSSIFKSNMVPSQKIQNALKKTTLLWQWALGEPLEILEKNFSVRAGAIISLAEETAWLISSWLALANAMGISSDRVKDIAVFEKSIRYGIPETGLDWTTGIKLTRSQIFLLLDNGFKTPKELIDYPDKLTNELDKIRTLLKLKMKKTQNKNLNPQLILSGERDGRRVKVILFGRMISITPKSFELLLKLSIARKHKPDGWIHKLDLDEFDEQVRKLGRLKSELKSAFPFEDIIENDSKGNYRIKFENIYFDKEKLIELGYGHIIIKK